jgi:uncharacterized protein (TIGR03000 family)
VRPGGAAFIRPGGNTFIRSGGNTFIRPGVGFASRGFNNFYRPYYALGVGGLGYYRPYYGYGLGGFGLGYGLGGYGLGGYGWGGYGYAPYYGGYGAGYGSGYYSPDAASPAVVTVPDGSAPNVGAAPEEKPPQDNAAHLQLIVPEDAEVYFDGVKTSKTGRVREFVSPVLTPGKSFTYVIEVRSGAATGKPVVDRREIHVGANDWFQIDFTKPAPANPPTTRPGAGPVMPPAADK